MCETHRTPLSWTATKPEVSVAREKQNFPETLADQLAPIALEIRRQHPRLHPLLQVAAEVDSTRGETAAGEARQEILKWVTKRSGKLPSEAWAHEGFSTSMAGRSATGVRLRYGDTDWWMVRCDDPDKSIPGRIWQTEAAIIRHRTDIRFTLRLLVGTQEDIANLVPAVPGLVRQLADLPGLQLSDKKIIPKAHFICNDLEAEELCEIIEQKKRLTPVIVVSLADDSDDVSTALVNANELALRLIGLAIVVVLSGPVSFILTRRWGKKWSCFHQGIRVYWPHFDPDTQSPYEHPLIIARRIEQWSTEYGQKLPDYILRTLCSASLTLLRDNHDIVPFTRVVQTARRLEREAAAGAGRSDHDLLEIAEEEIRAKEANLAVMEDMIKDEEDKRREVEKISEELRSENHNLRTYVELLRDRLRGLARSLEDEAPIPSSLTEVREWAENHLPGRVIITPKAARAAKNSLFENTPLAYKALLYLANEYRQMRLQGGAEAISNEQRALRQLGLQNEPSGDETRLRENGDEFLVDWRGRKRLLSWHLKGGGNTRDPKRCFRLYYLWDDEEELVVVGSMPGHLETRAS